MTAVNRIDLALKVFGRLVATECTELKKEVLHYWCNCECGNQVLVRAQLLRLGKTQSCGCLQKERASQASKRHGLSHTPIHNIWLSMLQRCNDKKCKAYPSYGGRGITVCDRWLVFEDFFADVGLPPDGMTLDRYPNNDGNYEPGNWRWATKVEQANNRRSNKLIAYANKTQTQVQWEDELGLRRGQIYDRLRRGWTIERALTTK
jgi:hypothetical protein